MYLEPSTKKDLTGVARMGAHNPKGMMLITSSLNVDGYQEIKGVEGVMGLAGF